MIVLCGACDGRGGPALGRPLLASPVSPASEPGLHRHLRLTARRTRLRASTADHARHRTDRRRIGPCTPTAPDTGTLAQARTRPAAARQPRGSSRQAWVASASAAHGASNAPTGVHARPRPPPHRPPTSGLGLCTQHRHQHRPAPGRPLLASPAAPASEPGIVRHLRLTELSMHSSPPCDKQRNARDENRERQQRRQIVCASGRGHPHGVPRAPMDRPSGYSSPMDLNHHPGSSGTRPGVVPRCLTVRVGAPQISALRHLRRLRTDGRLVARTLCDDVAW